MWERSRARRNHRRGLRAWEAGRFQVAQARGSRAVMLLERRRRRRPETSSAELAAALITLAGYHARLASHAAAERLHGQAVALLASEPRGPGENETLAYELVQLANSQRALGRYSSAEANLRSVLDHAQDDASGPVLLSCAHNALGIVYKETGRYSLSADHYRAAWKLSPESATGLRADIQHNLAGLDHVQGEFARAEAAARNAVNLREQAEGVDSTAVAADLAVLGAVLLGLDRLDEAEALLRRALTIWARRFGSGHYEIAPNLHNLGLLHHKRGEPDQALHCFTEALHIKQSVLGADHAEVAAIRNSLAVLHASQGRNQEARTCYDAALPVLARTLGERHPATERCRRNASLLS